MNDEDLFELKARILDNKNNIDRLIDLMEGFMERQGRIMAQLEVHSAALKRLDADNQS